MKKYLALIIPMLCAIFFIDRVYGNDLNDKEIRELHLDIEKMYSAFENGNADLFIKKSHASVYSLVGGKENFEKITKDAISNLDSQGIVFISAEIGKPSKIYPAGNEEVCIVPRISIMEVQGQKAKSTGFLIAIREKGSSKWNYLDGSGLRKDQSLLWKLLPNLSKDIELPPNYLEIL